MDEDSAREIAASMDPALIELAMEMAILERAAVSGEEEGLRAAGSIVKKAAALQRTFES